MPLIAASPSVHIINEAIGYLCTVIWSIGFIPRNYEVYRLKSGDGVSIDYVILNLVGFIFYNNYIWYGYFSNASFHDQVHISDLIYTAYSLVMEFLLLGLVLYYPRRKNRVHCYLFLLSASIFVVGIGSGLFLSIEAWYSFQGQLKVATVVLRYSPQIYLNCLRKATVGWNIHSIILDLIGGTLSIVQIFLDWATCDKEGFF